MISVIYIIMVTSGSENIWCVVIAHGHVSLCVHKLHTSRKTVSTILKTHGNRWSGFHSNNSYLDMNFFVTFLSVHHYKHISCSDYVTYNAGSYVHGLCGFEEGIILFFRVAISKISRVLQSFFNFLCDTIPERVHA